MELTLKQITERLKSLAKSHRQINTVFVGDIDDFLTTSPDIVYPACIISIMPESSIDITNREHKYNIKIQLYDLLQLADKSVENELDLQSDLSSIAGDFIAMINFNDYLQDWNVPENYTLRVANFQLSDVCAGVYFDLPVSAFYIADRCQIPAVGVTFEYDTDMKIVSNYIYTTIDEDVEEFTISTLKNKYIVLVLNGVQPLTPTTDAPTADEYRYTSSTGKFEFGTYVKSVQILNRNI